MKDTVDDYTGRYDISHEIIYDLLKQFEETDIFINKHPELYKNEKEWGEATVTCKYIVFILMLRVSEIMESESKK